MTMQEEPRLRTTAKRSSQRPSDRGGSDNRRAAWKQMAVIATRIATGLNGTDRDKSGTERYPSSKKLDKMG